MQAGHQERERPFADAVDVTYMELVATAERGVERLLELSQPDAVDLRRRLERLLPDLRRAAGLPDQAPTRARQRRQLSLFLRPVQ